jgi:hypothetical protein
MKGWRQVGLVLTLAVPVLGACGSTTENHPASGSAGTAGDGGGAGQAGTSGEPLAGGGSAAGDGGGSDGGVTHGGGAGRGGSGAGGSGSAGSAGTASSAGSGGSVGGMSEMLGDAEREALFEQAPHCTGLVELRIEGSIDGAAINDVRKSILNAGFINGQDGHFDTPFAGSLPEGQVELHLTWAVGAAYGDARYTSGGTVVSPAGPRANQELCVTQAAYGFPEEGDEKGAFKFWVRGARLGGCDGPEVPIELRGCMQ